MATFAGVSFGERGQGGVLVPLHGAAGVVGVRPRPNQEADPKFDRGGSTLSLLSMPIKCDGASLELLRYVERDTLVYSGGSVDAFMVEMKDAVKIKDSADLYFATLDFVILTSSTVVQDLAATATIVTSSVNAGATTYLQGFTVTHGIEDTGAARIQLDTLPASGVGEGGSVGVFVGVNGSAGSSLFAGTVVGRAYEHYPTGLAVDCRDRLEYVGYPYGGTERTYTAQTLGTVIQNLVEAQGIASANTSIEDSGWTVGIIEPVIFRRGDRFLPWIRTALNLAGYAIFTKASDSAVYVRPLQYGVTNGGTHTLTEAVNILSARREISRDGIYNAVQVDGLTYEGASVSVFVGTANSDVRDPPGTVAINVQSNLIESLARGTIVAQELLGQYNFKPESASIVVPGSAAIEPMDKLIVTHSQLGYSGATVAAVRVEHSLSTSGYITTVQAKRIR